MRTVLESTPDPSGRDLINVRFEGIATEVGNGRPKLSIASPVGSSQFQFPRISVPDVIERFVVHVRRLGSGRFSLRLSGGAPELKPWVPIVDSPRIRTFIPHRRPPRQRRRSRQSVGLFPSAKEPGTPFRQRSREQAIIISRPSSVWPELRLADERESFADRCGDRVAPVALGMGNPESARAGPECQLPGARRRDGRIDEAHGFAI